MVTLDLARWQFGITTVYHFILVPLTIGLSILVAYMQSKAYRTNSPVWERLTDFFGKILVINFALGVATGIVQEFQFGMGWSAYSKMVGDIFGAPLAFEALLAFFLESTFLGVWIFGKGRLPKKLHALSIWLFAIGTNISAWFILAANSFMQNPVGATFNGTAGRAELDGFSGFLNVLFQKQSVYAFIHTVSTSFLVAGALVGGVSVYWIRRAIREEREGEARKYWKPAARFGMRVAVVSGLIVALSGHFMAQHLVVTQPMKMAAAEALCKTETGAPFTLAAFGDLNDCERATRVLSVPGAYSFMATNDFGAKLEGMNELNQQMKEQMAKLYPDQAAKLQAIDYRPDVTTTFWTFRGMIFIGMLAVLIAAIGLVLLRGDRLYTKKWFTRLSLFAIPLPFIGSSLGWIFTEMGRQPWIVHPNLSATGTSLEKVRLLTQDAVSTVVQSWELWITLVVFTLLYLGLGIIWFWLIRRYTLEGINTESKLADEEPSLDAPLSFSY